MEVKSCQPKPCWPTYLTAVTSLCSRLCNMLVTYLILEHKRRDKIYWRGEEIPCCYRNNPFIIIDDIWTAKCYYSSSVTWAYLAAGGSRVGTGYQKTMQCHVRKQSSSFWNHECTALSTKLQSWLNNELNEAEVALTL